MQLHILFSFHSSDAKHNPGMEKTVLEEITFSRVTKHEKARRFHMLILKCSSFADMKMGWWRHT